MKALVFLLLAALLVNQSSAQTIQSARYATNSTAVVEVLYSDNTAWSVPVDPGNSRYRQLQEWIAGGGVISPKPPETSGEKRDRLLEELRRVHIAIDVYTKERDYWQGEGDTPKTTFFNNRLTAAQTRLSELRALFD